MKIHVCYKEGHATVSEGCRVFGFDNRNAEDRSGWVTYAAYELPDVSRLNMEMLDALSKFGVEYGDASFSSIVPESASVTAGILDMILARSEFSDIPYRSLTRQWRSDFWTEVVRRKIPVSELKEP